MKSSLAFLICGLVLHQTLGLDTIIDGGNLVLTTNANSTHVTFIAVREGTGYVGIGISPDGTGMTGADIVIAGCDDDTQEPYAVVRFHFLVKVKYPTVDRKPKLYDVFSRTILELETLDLLKTALRML